MHLTLCTRARACLTWGHPSRPMHPIGLQQHLGPHLLHTYTFFLSSWYTQVDKARWMPNHHSWTLAIPREGHHALEMSHSPTAATFSGASLGWPCISMHQCSCSAYMPGLTMSTAERRGVSTTSRRTWPAWWIVQHLSQHLAPCNISVEHTSACRVEGFKLNQAVERRCERSWQSEQQSSFPKHSQAGRLGSICHLGTYLHSFILKLR